MLHQQNLSGCKDSVFAIGENGISLSPHYVEVTALFSSAYSLGVDQVPFAVAIEEVRFHEKDSKMGNEIGNIQHMLQAEKFH